MRLRPDEHCRADCNQLVVAILAVVCAFQQPILVRHKDIDQSIHSSDSYAPAYFSETVWRTRSSLTYCVLTFDTLMENTSVTLKFKSRSPRGRWKVTAFSGNDVSRDSYFKRVVALSDARAIVEATSLVGGKPIQAVFRKTSAGTWARAGSDSPHHRIRVKVLSK
jgi:hypothetical protein